MSEQSKRDRAAFWDNRIQNWAATSYAQTRDDVMSRLRSSIDARKVEATRLLDEHLDRPFSMIDLGCGAGQFVLDLAADGRLSEGVGRDFSAEGIKIANDLLKSAREAEGYQGKDSKIAFEVGGVDEPWPDVEVVTGLGLLDWLDHDQIDGLFARLKGKRFIFSYSERDWTPAELVHRAYLVWRLKLRSDGVRAYHHTRGFILGLAEKHDLGPVEIVRTKSMRFGRLVHNLPQFSDS